MEKIPTLFERDWEGDRSRVIDKVVPGCEWVLDGEGVATRKYDGTCVMLDENRKWWARREVKDGKTPPPGFMSSGHDHITLKNIGWEPIEGSPFAKFHAEAVASGWEAANNPGDLAMNIIMPAFSPGTYELIGPKVQGNPEKVEKHTLVRHDDAEVVPLLARNYGGMQHSLAKLDVEGVVFHHEDGRMAKIKKRDFGLSRGTQT